MGNRAARRLPSAACLDQSRGEENQEMMRVRNTKIGTIRILLLAREEVEDRFLFVLVHLVEAQLHLVVDGPLAGAKADELRPEVRRPPPGEDAVVLVGRAAVVLVAFLATKLVESDSALGLGRVERPEGLPCALR